MIRRSRLFVAACGSAAIFLGLPRLSRARNFRRAVPLKQSRIRKAHFASHFLSFQNNPFFFPIRDGALAAAKYLKEQNTTVDYTVLGDNLTAEAVVSGIETAIAKKYNGIVVVPIFDGTARIIDEAVDAGIPVGNIIAEGAAPSKRLFFIRAGCESGRGANRKIY